MLLRLIKIILIGSVAAWGLGSTIINLMEYSSGVSAVGVVLSLEGQDTSRAISSPVFAHLGYGFVWGGKLVAGLLCLVGCVAMTRALQASPQGFMRAKYYAEAGLGAALIMLFLGFYVIAGVVFNPATGAPSAFARSYHQFAMFYIVAIGAIACFVRLPEPEVTR